MYTMPIKGICRNDVQLKARLLITFAYSILSFLAHYWNTDDNEDLGNSGFSGENKLESLKHHVLKS